MQQDYNRASRSIDAASLSQIVFDYEYELTIGDDTVTGNTHYQTINSPITQIRIRTPLLVGNTDDTPSMSIITSAGELDPMTLVPPPRRDRGRGR